MKIAYFLLPRSLNCFFFRSFFVISEGSKFDLIWSSPRTSTILQLLCGLSYLFRDLISVPWILPQRHWRPRFWPPVLGHWGKTQLQFHGMWQPCLDSISCYSSCQKVSVIGLVVLCFHSHNFSKIGDLSPAGLPMTSFPILLYDQWREEADKKRYVVSVAWSFVTTLDLFSNVVDCSDSNSTLVNYQGVHNNAQTFVFLKG